MREEENGVSSELKLISQSAALVKIKKGLVPLNRRRKKFLKDNMKIL